MARRPRTFRKSSEELLVGDYIQVVQERFTAEQRGLDEASTASSGSSTSTKRLFGNCFAGRCFGTMAL
jgi:hypothetical protein